MILDVSSVSNLNSITYEIANIAEGMADSTRAIVLLKPVNPSSFMIKNAINGYKNNFNTVPVNVKPILSLILSNFIDKPNDKIINGIVMSAKYLITFDRTGPIETL